MSSAILSVQDVAVYYGGVKAVDGVTFEVQKGQIQGLIGPNGAGKSTVIDAITGRRKVNKGQVFLNGQDVTQLGVLDRRRLGLARSFQKTSVFAEMTVVFRVYATSGGEGFRLWRATTFRFGFGLSG